MSAATLPFRGLGVSPSLQQVSRSCPKTQLSCKTCRRQKIRCDRERPCSACLHKGLGDSCEYPGAVTPDHHANDRRSGARARRTVQDRIQELEGLIMAIVQSGAAAGAAVQPPRQPSRPRQRPTPTQEPSPRDEPSPSQSQRRRSRNVSADEQRSRATPAKAENAGSIMRSLDGEEVSYVGGGHWAAILDSIAELKDQLSWLESGRPDTAAGNQMSGSAAGALNGSPGPLLFYDTTIPADRDLIIATLPSRSLVDNLVSGFFKSWDKSTFMIHDIQFMRQYEKFWQDPGAAPIIWIGLLYGIMGWSAFMRSIGDPHPPALVMAFRERTVQCLRIGQYTKASPWVIETLLLHTLLEQSLYADAQFSFQLLMGTVVQLARRMGYHRDASTFPPGVLTPFEGEMRRRIWSIINMFDIGSATQMGLPMTIHDDEVNTAEPRNLLNTDFDEDCFELPQSRPESEPTPSIFMIARARLCTVWRTVGRMVSSIEPSRHSDIMAAHRRLLRARHGLPAVLRCQQPAGSEGGRGKLPDISGSSTLDWDLGIQYVIIDTALLHIQILLHMKFLSQMKNSSHLDDANATATSEEEQNQRAFSEHAKLTAAALMLEKQLGVPQFLGDKQPVPCQANAAGDGGATPLDDLEMMRKLFSRSSLMNHAFLQATILLCQWWREGHPCYDPLPFPPDSMGSLTEEEQKVQGEIMDKVDLAPKRVRELLRGSLRIWRKGSEVSKEAQKAVAIVRLVLGEKEDCDYSVSGGSRPSAGADMPGANLDAGPGPGASPGIATWGGGRTGFATLNAGGGNYGVMSMPDMIGIPLNDNALLGLGTTGESHYSNAMWWRWPAKSATQYTG